MNTPTTRDGWVFMPLDEIEQSIEGVADIRKLRGLSKAFNIAQQTLMRVVTMGAGAPIKLKFFGEGH